MNLADMLIDTIPNREALAVELGRCGARVVAEVGVLEGAYSETLCRHIPDIEIYCIDPWTPSRNHVSQRRLDRQYKITKERLRSYNAKILRMKSIEGAKLIPDSTLDFVYIDAIHLYKSVLQDLEAWVPKVKDGGIVAGHDWGHLGVASAVNEYASKHSISKVYTTLPCEADLCPSWFWLKNNA